MKLTTFEQTFLEYMGQQPTVLLMATLQKKKQKKMPPHEKILFPTHIAHICLCLPTHKATQRQSQKSAIAYPLKNATNFTRKTYLCDLN